MAHALDPRKLILVATLVLAVFIAPAHAQQAVPFRGDRTVSLMTRNLYLGFDDLTPLFSAPLKRIPSVVSELWQRIQATDFPARAKFIADEINSIQPDLIGLQEVALYRTQYPGDFFSPTGNTPAQDVALDFLAILLKELSLRGLNYAVVIAVPSIDAELPSATGEDIRLTDRDVILARGDLTTADLELSNVQGGTFAAQLIVPLAGQPFAIPRAWAAVDAKVRGKTFRFVTTHLEDNADLVQVSQASELVEGPGNTDLPVVLVGDFNSNAAATGGGQTPTYGNLINAGLVDAWSLAGAGNGFTCCQAEDLLNFPSALDMRIDLILFRGGFQPLSADVFGDEHRTPAGLWPSDHAGVMATLQFR